MHDLAAVLVHHQQHVVQVLGNLRRERDGELDGSLRINDQGKLGFDTPVLREVCSESKMREKCIGDLKQEVKFFQFSLCWFSCCLSSGKIFFPNLCQF